MHRGENYAKGWSQGCILAVPNNPETTNNSATESLNFITGSIVPWVRNTEAEIRQNNPDIETIVKQIIITRTF